MRLKVGDSVADMNVLTTRRDAVPVPDEADDDNDQEQKKKKGGKVKKEKGGGGVVVGGEGTEDEYVLAVTSSGYGKRICTDEFRTTARGGAGVIAIKFKEAAGGTERVSCLRIVKEDDEILVITKGGIMVRQRVRDIPSQSRLATGVLVQKVNVEGGDHISSVSIVPKYEERDE